jgi:hypothetical protein
MSKIMVVPRNEEDTGEPLIEENPHEGPAESDKQKVSLFSRLLGAIEMGGKILPQRK